MKIPNLLSSVCIVLCSLAVASNLSSCSKSKSDADTNPPKDSVFPVTGKATFQKDGYTLIFMNNDPQFDTSLRTKMVNTFFIVYPKEVNRFNPNSTKTVTFSVDTSYSGVAATGNEETTFSAAYMHTNPKDIDVVTHEVMHIVQGYPKYDPVWLVEGIADYARFTYGVDNSGADWSLPSYASTQKYTDSYRITARFLVWLQENKLADIVDQFDKTLRENTYTDNTWKTITGKTIDELWEEYAKNPVLKEDAVPIGNATDITKNATISVSQENAGGASAAEGSSRLIDNDIYSKFFTAGFKSDLSMILKLSSAQQANEYVLTSGNDNQDRDPKSWKLFGSQNNKDWSELDSRSNETFTGRNLTKTYSFTNTISYQYFKLAISANNGSADFQLSEWRILKK